MITFVILTVSSRVLLSSFESTSLIPLAVRHHADLAPSIEATPLLLEFPR